MGTVDLRDFADGGQKITNLRDVVGRTPSEKRHIKPKKPISKKCVVEPVKGCLRDKTQTSNEQSLMGGEEISGQEENGRGTRKPLLRKD